MASLNATLLPIVQKANAFLADYILIFLLVGTGLFFSQFFLCQFAERVLTVDKTQPTSVVKIAMDSADIIHADHRSSGVIRDRARVITHVQQHHSGTGRIRYLVPCCLSVKIVKFIHFSASPFQIIHR